MTADHQQNSTWQAPAAADASDRARPADDCLASLLRTATRELNAHTSAGRLCAACGQPWPCSRVRLADLALAGW